jgi:hypothetical protein
VNVTLLRRIASIAGVAVTCAVFLVPGSTSARAADEGNVDDGPGTAPPAPPPSPGPGPTTYGYDISYPQCPQDFPSGGAFGIVGVNWGLPYSTNPCLAAESRWAAGLPGAPGFYMNTANPAPRSSYYWPKSGDRAPALCINASSTTDPGCAYDYGWHNAMNALATATAQTSRYTATHLAWWLDVETVNTWNGDGWSNAADVQGSIDYLRSQGVASVGVYSTDYQWTLITGGYTTSSASTYARHWSREFTSPYGIGSAPNWVAGAGSLSDAPSFCSASFTGVRVRLVQFPSGRFDGDYVCPGG